MNVDQFKGLLKSLDPQLCSEERLDGLMSQVYTRRRQDLEQLPYESVLQIIFGSQLARWSLEQRGRRLIEESMSEEPFAAVVDEAAGDEAAYKALVNYVAKRPPLKTRQGEHFLAVAKAGDCNAVPFDPVACACYFSSRKLRNYHGPFKPLSELSDVGSPDHTAVPLPWATELAWPVESVSEAERQALDELRAGNAKGADELRFNLHSGEGLLCGPWCFAFEDWPFKADLDVIKNDVCTKAQVKVLEQRERRGALSDAQVQRRRRDLARRFGMVQVNSAIFLEVLPALEREVALAAMRARWTRDRAEAEAAHEALAEAGASFVAWPQGRRWPPQPTAWVRWGKWFAMWRTRPPVAQSQRATQGTCAESVAESTASSWLAVSDISWVEIQSRADSEEQGWELLLEQLESSRPEINAAMASLDTLHKSDINEVKAMCKPPHVVVLVMSAVTCLLGKQPLRAKNGALDYWTPAKWLLADVTFLVRLKSLVFYVPPARLERAATFVAMEEFDPETVKNASMACAGICMFIKNLFRYHSLQSAAGEALELAERQAGIGAVGKALDAAGQAVGNSIAASLVALLEDGSPNFDSQIAKLILSCVQHLINPGGGTDVASLCGLADRLCVGVASWKREVDEGSEARFTKEARGCVEKAKRLKRFKGLEFSATRAGEVSEFAGFLVTWVTHALAYYDLVLPSRLVALQAAEAVKEREAKAAAEATEAETYRNPLPAIDKRDVQELKSLAKPPWPVFQVIFAVGILIGEFTPGEKLEESESEIGWKNCQTLLADPARFVDRLKQFEASIVKKPSLDRVRELASQHIFSLDTVLPRSKGAAGLAMWVTSVLKLTEDSESAQ